MANTDTEGDPTARVDLTLAGAATLRGPAGALVALGPRDAALLAWLALEGATPRIKLAALVWPDHDLDAARNNLRQRIFKLRRLAGAEVIGGSASLRLAPSVEHDLDDAEGLLADVPDEIGGEFSIWLAQQRERRRERVRHALVELVEMAEQAKDYADALVHAKELLALEPLSEDAHRRVIRLHYLGGDRAAALLAFDACERVLKDEVGTPPSPLTLDLLDTLNRADPVSAHAARSVPASVVRPPQRIGRGEVWEALCGARDAGSTVVLGGEAGMGKSRLLDELTLSRPDGGRWVAHVRARPGDAAVPFTTLARLVRALLARRDAEPPQAIREDLAHVMPEWSDARIPAQDDPRARIVRALESLWQEARDKGLCMTVVDDLHDADAASAEVLQPLVASGCGGWVFAMRRAEVEGSAAALVRSLEAAPATVCLELAPLSDGETGALLDSLGIDGLVGADHAAALARLTGGNPLYLLETVKVALARPETIASGDWPRAPGILRLIQRRLGQLSPIALQVARCVAVAGQDSSAALVAAVLGRRPIELVDAWAEVEASQLLRDGAFAHDLMAQATLASLPAAIARSLHGEVARWLEDRAVEPGRVASHWVAAAEPMRAVPSLLAAASRARDAWRGAEAAALYEQAAAHLRESGQTRAAFDALFAAADARTQAGLDERFAALHDAMAPLAEDEGQRAMLALIEVLQLIEFRRFDDARRVIDEALPLARRGSLPEIEANLLWGLAAMQWERREVAAATRLAEQAMALLSQVEPARRRLRSYRSDLKLTRALGLFHSASGRYAEGTAHLLEARRLSSLVGHEGQVLTIEQVLAANALDRGDLASARRWCESVLAGQGRVPFLASYQVVAAAVVGGILAANGELGAALAAYDRVETLCEGHPASRTHVNAMQVRALFWHELGRHDLAVQILRTLGRGRELSEAERANVEAASVAIGEGGDVERVLACVTGIDDFPLQVRLLCHVARACPAERLLPLLDVLRHRAGACGARGLWLGLQVRRAAALHAAGDAGAAAVAIEAWERIEAGDRWTEPLPQAVAWLCPVLTETFPDLAAAMALRGMGWIHAAAGTLDHAWRSNYLARTPSLDVLRNVPIDAAR